MKTLFRWCLWCFVSESIFWPVTQRQAAGLGRDIHLGTVSSGFVVQSLGSHRRSVATGASTRSLGRVRFSADVAQSVELQFCKLEVRGSSPLVSSKVTNTNQSRNEAGQLAGRYTDLCPIEFPEGCPSGQREQAVNLPAYAFGGSNPPPSTDCLSVRFKSNRHIYQLGWQAGPGSAIGRAPFCGSSSVGRASAFQAERREFESRLPLRTKCKDVFANQRRLASAHLAQMVERVLGKDEVTSSILVVGSKRPLRKIEAIT